MACNLSAKPEEEQHEFASKSSRSGGFQAAD